MKPEQLHRSAIRKTGIEAAIAAVTWFLFVVSLKVSAIPIAFRVVCLLIITGVLISFAKNFLDSIRTKGSKGIVRNAPGATLLKVAEFLYSPKTMELTFEALIADFRKEYYEALAQKRTRKCAWIRVRYYFLFIANMGLSKMWSVVTAIKQVVTK